MKIVPKKYVRILEAIVQMYPNDLKKAAEQFVFVLRRNHHTNLFSQVKRIFLEEQEKKNTDEIIRLQTEQTFSSEEERSIEDSIKKARDKHRSMKILWQKGEGLIGGARVRFGDRGYDESLSRRFRSLKEHLK